MGPLTNPRSDRVRAVAALSRRSARERTGWFLAEGPQTVREVVAYRGDLVVGVYVTESARARHVDVVEAAIRTGLAVHEASDEVLATMADAQTPPGLLAVCRIPRVGLGEVLDARPRLVCVLANVRDPGNAGTVLRGADAFGADAVVVTDGSVDVWSPKVVRSTAGLAFHLPVVTAVDARATVASLRGAGLRVYAADGAGPRTLAQVDLAAPHAWVMGNEAWGLPVELLSECDEVVRVPIVGRAESLNLAMAATVCLYASATAGRPASASNLEARRTGG